MENQEPTSNQVENTNEPEYQVETPNEPENELKTFAKKKKCRQRLGVFRSITSEQAVNILKVAVYSENVYDRQKAIASIIATITDINSHEQYAIAEVMLHNLFQDTEAYYAHITNFVSKGFNVYVKLKEPNQPNQPNQTT